MKYNNVKSLQRKASNHSNIQPISLLLVMQKKVFQIKIPIRTKYCTLKINGSPTNIGPTSTAFLLNSTV